MGHYFLDTQYNIKFKLNRFFAFSYGQPWLLQQQYKLTADSSERFGGRDDGGNEVI